MCLCQPNDSRHCGSQAKKSPKGIFIAIALLSLVAMSALAFAPVTTTVTTAWTTICEEREAGGLGNLTFKIKNTGVTNAFTDCKVESWVGPLAADWVVISSDWTACKTLAAGAMTTWEIAGNAHERLRVQVKSVGTTAYCRTYGN